MLKERKTNYEILKEDKETLKKMKYPTPAKYKTEFEFLKEIDCLALANTQLHLESVYKNFLEGILSFLSSSLRKNLWPLLLQIIKKQM
ncbi:MAG: hypothetical protein NTX05_02170 [Fusobacteria bacterium]|nr:hypothetical protein [Fusobacteriota bacterium]